MPSIVNRSPLIKSRQSAQLNYSRNIRQRTPQAAATQAIGSLIQGSGPSDLTGGVFYPPEAILPPRPRNARPRVAVGGGAPVTKKRFAVQ